MSLLLPKTVVWYCKSYTRRFGVQSEDRWTLRTDLRRMSDDMIKNNSTLTYEQALDIAVRVWSFAKSVAAKHDGIDDARLEQMCIPIPLSPDGREWARVRDMGDLVSYLDGEGSVQPSYLSRLLSLMTHTVADVINAEAPGFFHPEKVLARYCKSHLASHDDKTRAKMGWSELDAILLNNSWLTKEQAIGFAVESWRTSQTILRANVDELVDIATRHILITDYYLSHTEGQRLMEPVHSLLYNVRFGVSKELAMDFLARSMKVCADSLLLTCPEMFNNEKVDI